MIEPTVKQRGADLIVFDGSRLDDIEGEWFQAEHWHRLARVSGTAPGRGSAVFVRRDSETWVLRHYHRGGVMARLINDLYFWHGADNTRAFREWRLLAELYDGGFPVPRPVAARVRRRGLAYTADIITAFLEGTTSLDAMLHAGEPLADRWKTVGATLRRFHDRGVHHTDLNVRNILLDDRGGVYLVDFDKGTFRGPGSWRRNNLNRLQRSLRKTALETGVPYDESAWKLLEAGYGTRA
jgi:3-deoxy-D-manno-octulosonic acid kinase